ncbi:MAG: putative esterase [Caulobacteraceae bacterium]|nr:putative esterase [Caulobacteraceae bacterium]
MNKIWLRPAVAALIVCLGAGLAFAAEKLKNGDIVIGPDYKPDPATTDLGAARGRTFHFTMKLADSKFYDGKDPTLDAKKPVQTERVITVYVPAAYKNGAKAPVMVYFDGIGLTRGTAWNTKTLTGFDDMFDETTHTLDNLTVSKDPNRHLPPVVLVSVQNGGDDAWGSERGLEYDTLSDRMARFLTAEVFPAVVANSEIRKAYPNFALTSDPEQRATMGCSSGGAAAFTAAWFRPDLFRKVVAFSPTLVDQQNANTDEDKAYPLGAWEYHSDKRLISTSPKKPLRIFHTVGEMDMGVTAAEDGHRNWLMAAQRTSQALADKGYAYRFVYAKGGSHCDARVFAQTLPDALVWAWQGVR